MLKVIEYNGNLEAVALKLDNRKENISKEVNDAVMKIIDDINKRGNEALYEYCLKFDGYQIKDEADLIVSEAEKEIALKQVDANYLRILERTKEQIIEFHKNQIDKSWSLFKENGVTGWKRNYPVKGHPDFVFLKQRIAVFVDGCFWHGHDCRNTRPSANEEFWRKKRERNIKHDKEITELFESRGWTVIRIWECELKRQNYERTLLKIKKHLSLD